MTSASYQTYVHARAIAITSTAVIKLSSAQVLAGLAEAVRLVPAGDIETRWRYIMDKAAAKQTMSDERGNNPALEQAITTYRAALPLAPAWSDLSTGP